MRLYTKTGDNGQSSLFNGERLAKNDQHFTALGDIDELNCQIGIAISLNPSTDIQKDLLNIQKKLMSLSSIVAKAQSSRDQVTEKDTFDLEEKIDLLCQKTPELKNLILAGGCQLGAQLHLCRSLIRRTERNLINLNATTQVPQAALIYINRLSDYFFALARFINNQNQTPEHEWITSNLNTSN